MQQTKREFAIVYALDGYDEISLTGNFKWRTRFNDQTLSPESLNRNRWTQKDLYGGETPEAAAAIFLGVLKNECTTAQFEVVSANAGMAINVIKPDQSISDCIAEAEESIKSGKAFEVLKKVTT